MRLFAAVDPGERFRVALTPALDAWRRTVDLRWVRPENLHVTLRFLGDWPDDRRGDLDAALRAAVRGLGPFPLEAAGLGTFPRRGDPRVLFLHLDGGGRLADLARCVSEEIDAACPGVGAPAGEFRTHLTLARARGAAQAAAAAALRDGAGVRLPGFRVDEVRLMASELRPDGPRYAVQGVFPLAGAGAA